MIASIVLALHLLGVIPLGEAVTFLFIVGALLLIAEFFVTSFGMLGLNGILSLFLAYSLKTGQHTILGIELGWPLFFGIAFVEFSLLAGATYMLMRMRGKPVTTGQEAMIGATATIIDWNGKKGNVRYQGESWKAVSAQDMPLTQDTEVKIVSIKGCRPKYYYTA